MMNKTVWKQLIAIALISADFSQGDQTITPDERFVWKKTEQSSSSLDWLATPLGLRSHDTAI